MNNVPFTRKLILLLALLLVTVSSACTLNISIGPGAAVTPTDNVVSEPTRAPAPTQPPEPASGDLVACSPYVCSGPGFWKLGANGPEALALSVGPGLAYDTAAATGRLLYRSKQADQGAGPGNISVGDLWWLDVRSGQTRPIFMDEVIVEAAWAPDGQNFAYVRATPETYELHWYTANGEDKLLARDVAFTFSVSNAGDQVAFTRESHYNLDIIPGLYVVDVASGQERQISPVDRAGTGSISDQPIWSLDNRHILLVTAGDLNSWLIASSDGSQSAQLKIAPEVSETLQNDGLSFVLWHPDGVHLVGSSFPGMQGGPGKVVLFGLNSTLDTVVSATVLKDNDSVAVGWDKPGVSLWIRSPEGKLENVPLK